VRSHVHPRQEERFVVLEGRFVYQIGDHEGVGRPGETLACPVAVPDSQRNPAMGDAHPLRAPPGARVGRDLLQDERRRLQRRSSPVAWCTAMTMLGAVAPVVSGVARRASG
jgi:hypothetical protein